MRANYLCYETQQIGELVIRPRVVIRRMPASRYGDQESFAGDRSKTVQCIHEIRGKRRKIPQMP